MSTLTSVLLIYAFGVLVGGVLGVLAVCIVWMYGPKD